MSKDVHVWRDKHDGNQFWIGVKSGNTFYGWMPTFCDAFVDCFGQDAWEAVKDLPKGCDPVPIKLTFTILPKESA